MFWRFGFASASAIDALLDREDIALEAVLDEDELLQECKAQNTRLIDYFQRRDVLKRLLAYAAGDLPPAMDEEDTTRFFKYPYVATEVLCSEIWSIVETCLRHADELLTPYWEAVLDRPPEEVKSQIALATHFMKINGVFLSKKPIEMWEFMKTQPNMLERLLAHLDTEPFLDLLVRILHEPAVPDIAGWFTRERLIPRLVARLGPEYGSDMHAVVAELVARIISMAAPAPGADGPGGGPPSAVPSNTFARELATRESIIALVGFVLQPFDGAAPDVLRAVSSVTYAIAVLVELIRKNNSDYFEPFLFHTLRNRLIHAQQQLSSDATASADPRTALEAALAEMVEGMGVVHLGPLLEVICERMDEFQELLRKPRSLVGAVSTTVGEITPLTTERYRICELYAELLHCSNMGLLNRGPEYAHLYDGAGRLRGGLSGLEELAQVIALGGSAAAGGDADASMDGEDELEPAAELPVSDPTAHAVDVDEEDEDEEMSSDGEPGSSDEDDAMDDVALDPPASSSPAAAHLTMSPHPLQSPGELPDSASSPFATPPPPSPGASVDSPSPRPRPRSQHSRRSLRQSSRQNSLQVAAMLPPGERLKQKFLESDVLPVMLDLFFEFPWNNFLHSVVYDLVHQILTGRVDTGLNRELIVGLFREGRLMHRIVEGQKLNDAESAKPKGVRLGYMGHLTLMSEDVIAALDHYPPDLLVQLAPCAPVPAWDEYVTGRYHETKQRDSTLLGGGKPVIAPGQQRGPTGRLKVDESEAQAASGAGAAVGEDTRGDFRRTTSGHPVRQTADFGPAPVDNEDSDEEDEGPPPQFARYLVSEAHSSAQYESGSDDEEDVNEGWLARSTFEMGPPPASARRPLPAQGFDDTFGATTNAALAHHSYDDSFTPEDDDGFGPFSDSAASGSDPFTFSPHEDGDTFADFGEFGDFQHASGDEDDGASTPTAESWSFTSAGSFGGSDAGPEDVHEKEESTRTGAAS